MSKQETRYKVSDNIVYKEVKDEWEPVKEIEFDGKDLYFRDFVE
jgi:hypothetical protein